MSTGVVVEEIYLRNNRKHRDPAEGPAWIKRAPGSGVTVFEGYCRDGKLDREDGPAEVRRDKRTGNVTNVKYWRKGKRHRDPAEGPASTVFDAKTGRVAGEAYVWQGQHYREEGPAVICYRKNGEILYANHGCSIDEFPPDLRPPVRGDNAQRPSEPGRYGRPNPPMRPSRHEPEPN